MLHPNMVIITLAVLQELDKLQSSAKQDVAQAQAQVRYPSVTKILDLYSYAHNLSSYLSDNE